MRARAVIGASFGDEGKGAVTDYLCSLGAGMVVRFNGGAQAGHTVVTPDGYRHVFGHFGAGTFFGVPTFLSQFFVCNPLLFLQEGAKLNKIMELPQVYAHPNCLVTTFADMMINQTLEKQRGDKRHGSCGLGINETINRSTISKLKITMSDLWNEVDLHDTLAELCSSYATFRTGKPIDKPDAMIEEFIKRTKKVANIIAPLGIAQCEDIVFEGAQGLMLDQNNKKFFPHLTRSNTGMKNIRELCAQAKIDEVDIYYVSRTYLTRHGAGPLPGEDPNLSYKDNTNAEHDFQGRLRFAPLNYPELIERCKEDAKGEFNLVLTHCDQKAPEDDAQLYFYGPTREDVRYAAREAA